MFNIARRPPDGLTMRPRQPIPGREPIHIGRCPMPDHPPCQIIPHPLAQSASALGSRKIVYCSLFSTFRLAALIEWETGIRQDGEAVF